VIKVEGVESAGRVTVLEATIAPQSGPPPHIHDREDETFYILDGEFEFLAGDTTVRAGAGSFVFAPRGQVHAYRNVGEREARLLVTIMPAGIETFFRHLDALPPGPPDLAKITAIAREYGITILPPPSPSAPGA
jgi:quercetin dioxygenase-like cupin family protein